MTPRYPARVTLLLRSERVLLGDGARGFRLVPADVLIRDGLIVSVTEPGPEGFPDAPDAVHLRHALLTPAFVNAHTHLAMSAFRGLATNRVISGNVVEELYFRVESHLQPGDVRAFSRLGAWESLLSGVGCVWDHYYYGREMVDALLDVGLEGVVAPTLQDVAGPGVPWLDDQWEQTLALIGDASLAERGIVPALGPHASDTVSPELWRRITEVSATHDLPIHVHVAQSIEEVDRAWDRHGCSPVASLERAGVLADAAGVLLVHCLFTSRDDLALLDPARHRLVHCPWSQVQFGFPAAERTWAEAGLEVALGTDCGSSNDAMDVQGELRLMAWGGSYATTWSDPLERFLASGSQADARAVQAHRSGQIAQQQKWETTERLLDAVWRIPGAAHPGAPQGVIAPGMRANLAVWDANHPALWPGNDYLHAFVMGSMRDALRGLYLGGRTVIDPATGPSALLAGDTFAEHRREASERLTKLLERAGVDPHPWKARE